MKSHSIARSLLLPLAGILLILAASGCGLTDITASLDLVKVTEVSLENATVEIHVQVNNPSAIGIALDNIAVNLAVAGRPLIEVVKQGPINIAAHSSSRFVIPVSVRFDRLYDLYELTKDKDEVAFSANGRIRLKTAIGDPNIYFKASGTMPMLRPPDISIASWCVRELDVKHLRFDVTLKIKNNSRRELVMKNLAYTVGFKNTNLINRQQDELVLFRPRQVLLMKVPAEVDIAAIRRSGLDEILWEKLAQIKMRDLSTIGLAFGDGPTGLSRFARYAIDTLSTADNAKEFEERLPLLRTSMAAAEGAALLGLTNRNVNSSEPQTIAPVQPKTSFLENKRGGMALLLFCLPVGVVLTWVKARWKTGAKIATTVALILLLGLTFIMVIAAGPKSNAQQAAGAAVAIDPVSTETAEVAAPPAPQIPRPDFVLERLAFCERYEQASNDIKRSEIYTNFFGQTMLKPYLVQDMPGVLRKMATSRGGGIVLLMVDTEVGAFGNNDMMQGGFFKSRREIRKGSNLYNHIGELMEGQKVTFSGRLIIAEKEPTEQMSVCGDGWLIKFTDIKAAH